jgi:exodeoxyribonuclease VII small subunit
MTKSPDKTVEKGLPPENMPETFEKAMAELDGIIAEMERGDAPLEDSLTSYKRGAVLIEYCRNSLAKVESQVKVLEADLLKPYE